FGPRHLVLDLVIAARDCLESVNQFVLPALPGLAGQPQRRSESSAVQTLGGFPTRGACPPCAFSCRSSGAFLLTFASAVERADRDLEHVVGRFARGELLRAKHRQHRYSPHP